jgi:hypothetical protein
VEVDAQQIAHGVVVFGAIQPAGGDVARVRPDELVFAPEFSL